MVDSLRRSRFRRALSLSKLGAQVALSQGRRLVSRDEGAVHRKIAETLVRELGQLKGLPMKIGQVLSYMDGIVPDEYADIYADVLGKLRTHSHPMGTEAWREVFIEDLGRPPEELFDEFDPEPIAAASIGQVHRAVLRGQVLCVKVQYPGIAEATQSDLKNLDSFVAVIRRLNPHLDAQQMIVDFRERLEDECDYNKEAAYQARFAEIYADDPDLLVPVTVGELCTRRVLTTRMIGGVSLDTFMKDATAAERNRAGESLFRFAFGTLLEHGLFHADPHPGNLMFRADDSGRLGVLDFGCVQPVDDDARRDLAILMDAAVRGGDVAPAITALGITEIDDFTRDLVCKLVRQVLAPVIEPQPFRFTRSFAAELVSAVVEAKKATALRFLTRRGRIVAQREGVMFIVRNLFGLASIWGTLQATGNFRDLTAAMVSRTLASLGNPAKAAGAT